MRGIISFFAMKQSGQRPELITSCLRVVNLFLQTLQIRFSFSVKLIFFHAPYFFKNISSAQLQLGCFTPPPEKPEAFFIVNSTALGCAHVCYLFYSVIYFDETFKFPFFHMRSPVYFLFLSIAANLLLPTITSKASPRFAT